MHFRKQSSYNRVDSKIRKPKIGKRIVVTHGVKKRCHTILKAFGRVKNKARSCFQMHRLVSKRYSVDDIAYAFKRLEKAKMLERVSTRGDRHMLMRRRRNWKSLWQKS
jgi:hypothetical protein